MLQVVQLNANSNSFHFILDCHLLLCFFRFKTELHHLFSKEGLSPRRIKTFKFKLQWQSGRRHKDLLNINETAHTHMNINATFCSTTRRICSACDIVVSHNFIVGQRGAKTAKTDINTVWHLSCDDSLASQSLR